MQYVIIIASVNVQNQLPVTNAHAVHSSPCSLHKYKPSNDDVKQQSGKHRQRSPSRGNQFAHENYRGCEDGKMREREGRNMLDRLILTARIQKRG